MGVQEMSQTMNSKYRIILIGLLLSGTAFACRYNVRDIGFVDLGQSTTRLYIFLAEDQADLRDELQSILSKTLDETNIMAELVRPGSQIETIDTPEHLPTAVLVSPRGRLLSLPLDASDGTVSQKLTELTTQLAHSPLKTDILKQVSGRFAVVLLIESDDALKNRQAALTVETSLMHIEQQMIFMPKRIQSPPVMVKLTADEAEQHKTLLWELGITLHNEPTVAILYGRLRVMGPVLTAEDITEETLNAYLGVIGADCECDLDRRLLHSPMLVHHWPRAMYEGMTEALGFDPENPQVKMEISQIITAHASVGTGELQRPDVTFGYEEFVIEDSTVPQAVPQDTSHMSQDTSHVPKVAVVENEPPQKRSEPLAEAITPSSKWPLYSLLAMAAAVILTGIIIARKRSH
jgi:hypothetical protein